MPTYQVFSLAVTEALEYTLGGGTEAEWLAHVSEEPTNPSAVVKYASAEKVTAKFRVSLKIAGTALNTALEAGEKVTGITYHFNIKGAAEAKTVKIGAVTPEDETEPTIKVAQSWFSVTATEAHAKELTKAKLEELRLNCKNILAKKVEIFEVYATVTTEVAASGYIAPAMPPTFFGPRGLYRPEQYLGYPEVGQILQGKAEGSLLLTGTSHGLAVQKVLGAASGTLLLTGTSTGAAAQRVKGIATGALLLTGTSQATLASVLKGTATGALLLTGTSKGIAAQRISAAAAGALLLTGASKGTLSEPGVKGKATGTILLTGTATAREVLLAKASGTLFLLGGGVGTASEAKAGKRAIFIFDE